MSRGPDAGILLERALLASAAAAGCPVVITKSSSTRWASATFTGARHRLTLTASASPALDAWLASLPEAEFALGEHLVADAVIEGTRRDGTVLTAVVEVLTVETR